MTRMIWCHFYLMTCTNDSKTSGSLVSNQLSVDSSRWRIYGNVYFVPCSVLCGLNLLQEWVWISSSGPGRRWKEQPQEPLGKSWEASGHPVDGLEGGQKSFNDVEAEGAPRQLTARERTVMKQNSWVIRLNSHESEWDCMSPLLFIEFLPSQDSVGQWNSLLTRIFLVSLGPVQGKQTLS